MIPAQALRGVCDEFSDVLNAATPVVICAKGIERDSGALMSEVVARALPGRPIAVLSGPTFAGEVARGLPTAVTLACADPGVAARLVEALGSRAFRPYASDDVIGAEVAGAVKNVLAIACGITASAADMARRIEQGFTILGAGRAGGGLPASVDAALKAGRAAR